MNLRFHELVHNEHAHYTVDWFINEKRKAKDQKWKTKNKRSKTKSKRQNLVAILGFHNWGGFPDWGKNGSLNLASKVLWQVLAWSGSCQFYGISLDLMLEQWWLGKPNITLHDKAFITGKHFRKTDSFTFRAEITDNFLALWCAKFYIYKG